MIRVDPLTLELNGVRLEPLAASHAAGLRAAACDGSIGDTSMYIVRAERPVIASVLRQRPRCPRAPLTC